MNNVVLDASVLLAILREEVAEDVSQRLIDGAFVSTVNLAEVLTKLHDLQPGPYPLAEALFTRLGAIQPFSRRHAYDAANLRAATKSAGLSLGDRACIALAMELDADVYTADRAWTTLNLPCRVHLVR